MYSDMNSIGRPLTALYVTACKFLSALLLGVTIPLWGEGAAVAKAWYRESLEQCLGVTFLSWRRLKTEIAKLLAMPLIAVTLGRRWAKAVIVRGHKS